MVSASVRRQQIAYVCQRGRSVRRACALLSVARSTVGYQPRLPQRDAPAVAVMQELAAQYPRYGYRRIQVFLGRRGHAMSTDRAHRLWRLHKLQVPRKRPRRRVASGRPRPLPATAMGQVWAYDFVFDACANGQQLKCLTVVDEFTRECLAIDVAGSIRSGRVIEVLEQAGQHSWQSQVPAIRQRPGVCLQSSTEVADAGEHRYRAHRPGQAMAERQQRVIQRQIPRRMPEHGVVQK